MPWSNKSRHERGYGHQWDKLRKVILTRDSYLCQACKAKGRITAASQVDHVKVKAKGGTDDPANLRSLCAPCHVDKTTRDNGGRVKVRIGPNGWPE